MREWLGCLHKAKEAKGLATVKDMRGRATRWVFPVFGDVDMRAITREDRELLVASLDAAVAAFMKQGPAKGRLSPSAAANVWGDVQHSFDEAVNAKAPALRVLERAARRGCGRHGAGARRPSRSGGVAMSAPNKKAANARKPKARKPTRKELGERMRVLADEILQIEDVPFAEDNARMVHSILDVPSFMFDHFPTDTAANRIEHAKQMTAALNALCPRWRPEARWWLAAEERGALMAREAVRTGHTRE